MNIKILPTGLLSIVILLLFSCDDRNKLSLDVDNAQERISGHVTDTITIVSSVMNIEPINTGIDYNNYASTAARLLFGSTQNAYFGKTYAESYANVTLSRDSVSFTTTEFPMAIFDSLVFLSSINYTYGDSLQAQTLEIHQLGQSLDTGIVGNYYNSDRLPVARLLGSANLRTSTNAQTKDIRMRLDNNIGREIMAMSGKSELRNQTNFKEYFKGIRISSKSADKAAIIGLNMVLTRLRLFYKRSLTDTVSIFFDMNVLNSVNLNFQKAYNYIQTSRSTATFLGGIGQGSAISTTKTGRQGYVQGGGGVATRITFPHLANLSKNQKVVINRAELLLQPAAETFNLINQPPPSRLFFAISDPNGNFLPDGNGLTTYLFSELLTSDNRDNRAQLEYVANGKSYVGYNPATSAYSEGLNVTSYIQSILDKKLSNNGLIIRASPSDLSGSVNGLWFNDNSSPQENRLKLRIYYTVVKQ